MIVVDASVVIEVLLGTAAGRAVEGRLFDPAPTLHAPHLVDVEVAQVLRRYAASGELDAGQGGGGRRGPPGPADHEARARACCCRASGSSAATSRRTTPAYVALADALDATLLTRDGKLARAAGRTRVELLK